MVKNPQLLKDFEDSLIKSVGRYPLPYSLRIFEALWDEGKKLGVIPLRDPMEGIEVDIRIARILNKCLKNSSQE